MNRARGIMCAYAMARPRSCQTLDGAILTALGQMPDTLSQRSKARNLAGRVAAAILLQDKRTEAMEIAMADLAAMLRPDPVVTIAQSMGQALLQKRSEKFVARGGQQLSPGDWHAETVEIIKGIEAQLFERFRNAQRKRVKTGFLPADL